MVLSGFRSFLVLVLTGKMKQISIRIIDRNPPRDSDKTLHIAQRS